MIPPWNCVEQPTDSTCQRELESTTCLPAGRLKSRPPFASNRGFTLPDAKSGWVSKTRPYEGDESTKDHPDILPSIKSRARLELISESVRNILQNTRGGGKQ